MVHLPWSALVLLVPLGAAAQTPESARAPLPFLLGANVHAGFIIPHSKELVDVSNSHPKGIELELEWLLADEHHTRRNGMVAKRGLALHLIDFGDPELLGRVISVTPFVEPMIRAQDRLHGSVRLGAGVALLNRPYDPETNPRNLFYSSPVSFTAMVCAYLGYRVTPHWTARAGFNFNHISNAGMAQPNKGINYPTWSLGAEYSLEPLHVQRPVRDDDWRTARRTYAYAVASLSIKTAPVDDGVQSAVPCYLTGGMGLAGWRTGRLTALAGGTEWVHDGYTREMLDRVGSPVSAWKGAIMLGPELVSGRARLGVLFGVYVFAPSWDGDPVYQRYQLAYTIGRNLLVGTSLKAHRHVADVADVRLGWIW